MIFNVVISASIQELCYLRPLVPVLNVQLKYFVVFIFAPAIFLYIWVQMIVPSLSTLFPDSSFQIIGDLAPVLGTMQSHLLN